MYTNYKSKIIKHDNIFKIEILKCIYINEIYFLIEKNELIITN